MSWNGSARKIWLCFRVQDEMIPLLTTCCCGIVSVRTAALLVAALFIVRRVTSESYIYLLPVLSNSGGLDSTVGIATRYSLHGPGVESRWRRDFPCRPNRPQAPPSLLYNRYWIFFRDKAAGAWSWPSVFFSDRQYFKWAPFGTVKANGSCTRFQNHQYVFISIHGKAFPIEILFS